VAVIKSPADGHALLITTDSTVTSNPSIYSKLPYDPTRDLAPVTLMAWSRLAIVVNANSGLKSVPELIQSAKANPGKLNFGAGSITARLTGELFKRKLGLDIVFIPYTGARSVEGLLSGDVTFLVVAGSTVLPYIQNGRFRALAATGAQPMRSLPGVPTVAEAANLPGFDTSVWLGLFAPAGTPPAVLQRLYQDFTQALSQPEVRERLEAIGLDPATMPPAEFSEFIRKETEIWSRIVRQAGIQGD
jgi:tripartite-type tricarboxylate transporter receptor subunit TctC